MLNDFSAKTARLCQEHLELLDNNNPISMQKSPWSGFGPAYEEVEIIINNNIN